MKFASRLKFYVFGILIGVLISYMFFGNRGCAWLPGTRVKAAIMDFPWVTTPQLDCQLRALNLNPSNLKTFIENSSINFNKSQTEVNPRIYNLSCDQKEILFAVSFTDSTSTINGFSGNFNPSLPLCDTINNTEVIKSNKSLRDYTKTTTPNY